MLLGRFVWNQTSFPTAAMGESLLYTFFFLFLISTSLFLLPGSFPHPHLCFKFCLGEAYNTIGSYKRMFIIYNVIQGPAIGELTNVFNQAFPAIIYWHDCCW